MAEASNALPRRRVSGTGSVVTGRLVGLIDGRVPAGAARPEPGPAYRGLTIAGRAHLAAAARMGSAEPVTRGASSRGCVAKSQRAWWDRNARSRANDRDS